MSENETFGMNEKIKINNKDLQYGVLYDEAKTSYQLYLAPDMTVAEMAFDIMVTIRILISSGYIKNKGEFIKLVNKYFNDPQYKPLNKEDYEN